MLATVMDEDDYIENYPESEEQAISSIVGSYFGKTLNRHSIFLHEKVQCGIVGNLKRDKNKEVVFVQDKRGILEVWRWPYHMVRNHDGTPWTKRYAIGSDVSEGLGESFSVGYVKDRLLDEYTCRIRSNRIDAYAWGDQLLMLSEFYSHARKDIEWFKPEKALICPETTGPGQTTVKYLKDKLANLYVQQARGKVGSEMVKRFGWHESQQAKYDLSEDLREYFKKTTGRVYCPILIEECSTWIKHEGSMKIGPEDETKLGDCVIAAGLAEQASMFMGGSPKKIPRPVEGWRKRVNDGRGSNWAV